MGLQQTSEKTMGKNIFIWGIFCVLSAVLFSSCNKEDEIDNGTQGAVVKNQKHLISSTFYTTDESTNTTYIILQMRNHQK